MNEGNGVSRRQYVLGGMAGLALTACGGGGNDNQLELNSIGESGTLSKAAVGACSSSGGVNVTGFSNKFNDYYKKIMGEAGANGTVFTKLNYKNANGSDQNVAVCMDKSSYTIFTGQSYSNTAKTEGQGYGMVLAVAANDKAKFYQLWHYTDLHMRNSQGLFDWLTTPNDGSKHVGTGIAPDGELWIITGLLMAWQRWDDNGYRDAAFGLMDNLKKYYNNLFKDGVFRSYWDANDTNPSYINPAFMAYWDKLRPNNGWDKPVAPGRKLLVNSTNNSSGLAPDWTGFDGRVARGSSHFYDAYRVAMNQALDKVWNGSNDHTTNAQKAVNTLNGKFSNSTQKAMYACYALTGVGQCNSKVTPFTYSLLNDALDTSYYSGLLSAIACGILGNRITRF